MNKGSPGFFGGPLFTCGLSARIGRSDAVGGARDLVTRSAGFLYIPTIPLPRRPLGWLPLSARMKPCRARDQSTLILMGTRALMCHQLGLHPTHQVIENATTREAIGGRPASDAFNSNIFGRALRVRISAPSAGKRDNHLRPQLRVCGDEAGVMPVANKALARVTCSVALQSVNSILMMVPT